MRSSAFFLIACNFEIDIAESIAFQLEEKRRGEVSTHLSLRIRLPLLETINFEFKEFL